LEKVGLSKYEARAYTTLLFLGPSKAIQISKESQIPQSKIYQILEQLSLKQLVESLEGRPKEFKAVSPEIALLRLIEEREKEIIKLKEDVKEIHKVLEPLTFPETSYGIWVIKGRKWREFFNKAAEMIDRSRKYVYAVTREYSRTSKLAEAVKRCVRRGVKLRIIGLSRPTSESYLRFKWYKEHGIRIKVFETKAHPRILLIDGREVLLRLDSKLTKKNGFLFYSLWSQDESLVKVIDSYVKTLWKNALPVNHFGIR
jgi:sugar-specific transcriptional regulator TrmB